MTCGKIRKQGDKSISSRYCKIVSGYRKTIYGIKRCFFRIDIRKKPLNRVHQSTVFILFPPSSSSSSRLHLHLEGLTPSLTPLANLTFDRGPLLRTIKADYAKI